MSHYFLTPAICVLKKIDEYEKQRTDTDTPQWYTGPDCLSVPVVYPGSDKEYSIEFHNGVASLSHYIERDFFISSLESDGQTAST